MGIPSDVMVVNGAHGVATVTEAVASSDVGLWKFERETMFDVNYLWIEVFL